MANDVGVRQALLSKGYSNDDIGYDQGSGYVTVKGQNFIKPELNMSGTTYTNQQNFNNAYNQYTKSQQAQQQPTQSTYQQPAQTSYQQSNPYVDQYTQMIKSIQDRVNAPAQDVYSSPQYAAAQAQAQRQADQSIRSGQEMLGTSGMARSSDAINWGQNAQNQANEYLQLQLVPQIQQQLAQQRQADINNQLQQAGLVYNLLGRQDTQNQNDISNRIAKSNVTGYYDENPDYVSYIRNIMDKNSAAYGSASPEEQARLHQENLKLAASIGGTDTTGNGDYAFGPMRTLQGQQLDYNQAADQRDFGLNQTQTLAQLTGYLPDGTPTNAKQQQDLQNLWLVAQQTGTIPNDLADLYGIPRGTKTQEAMQLATENSRADRQLNANLANMTSDNARAAAAEARAAGNQNLGSLFDIWDRTGIAPAGIPGVAAGTQLRDKSSSATAKSTDYKTDPNFAEDVAFLKANPKEAAKLDSHAQDFITQYGYDGYLALRKAAGLD